MGGASNIFIPFASAMRDTDRQREREIERQTERESEMERETELERPRARNTGRHRLESASERQTDRQRAIKQTDSERAIKAIVWVLVRHLAEVGPEVEAGGPVEVGHAQSGQLRRNVAMARLQPALVLRQEHLTDPVWSARTHTHTHTHTLIN